MSIPEHVVATPLNMCRARRDERVAPCCPTSATQHVTTFSCAKMHGLDSVSCHVVTWRNKWNLGLTQDEDENRPPCVKRYER